MTGSHRVVRALFAALITTLLALLMHTGAGGSVSPIGTGIVFVLVLWSAMILSGRRLGYVSVTALLSLGQLLMHFSMGWFGTSSAAHHAASAAANPGGPAAGAHAGHITPATGSLDLSHAVTMTHSHGGDAGPGMVLAHIIAVLFTAVILKRGEDIVFSILQLAVGPVSSALRSLAEAAVSLAEFPARSIPGQFRLPQVISSAVIGANYRRGPPALV